MTVEKMKYYYDQGLWSKERIEKIYQLGKISEDELKYILSE